MFPNYDSFERSFFINNQFLLSPFLGLIKNWSASPWMRLDSRVKPDVGGASGDAKPGDCPAESQHSQKRWLVLQSVVAFLRAPK